MTAIAYDVKLLNLLEVCYKCVSLSPPYMHTWKSAQKRSVFFHKEMKNEVAQKCEFLGFSNVTKIPRLEALSKTLRATSNNKFAI